jgi:hypothetical protein
MSGKRLALVVILSVLLVCLSVAPAAAVQQWPPDRPLVTPDTDTGLTMITPGDTVAVPEDAVAYNLTALRNQTTDNPITELRMYENDTVEGDPIHTIDVDFDSNFALGAEDLEENFGTYFPYSEEDDAVIEENAIVLQQEEAVAPPADNETDNVTPGVTPEDNVTPGVTPEDNVTPGVTPADNVTPGVTPADNVTPGATPVNITPEETPVEPTPTPAPLSLASVLGALGIMGILILIRKKR